MADKWYTLIKKPQHTGVDILKLSTPPTDSSHGDSYLYAFGGYKTRREAIRVALYQNHTICNLSSETIQDVYNRRDSR